MRRDRHRRAHLRGLAEQREEPPLRPRADAIWSITPHGAPTTRFSTFWQSSATASSEPTERPLAPSTAIIVATSTAADDETPFPSGTRELTTMSIPPKAAPATSCSSTDSTPTTYAAHDVDGSAPRRARIAASGVGAPPAVRSSASSISKSGARPPAAAPKETTRTEVRSGRSCSATHAASAIGICRTSEPL